MTTGEIITISLFLTGLVFLLNERKRLVNFIKKEKNKRNNVKGIREIEQIMEEENVSERLKIF